ncbi:MAG: hypothetical protein GF334_01250 [Candidatus Altiarchaeales archaeon]|nr:hypothetical protein [Candidatus Altiarchaeales archaeon]
MGKTKKVFTPTEYEVPIGENKYIIGPRPMQDVIDFYEVIEDLIDDFDDALTINYFVEVEGERVAGPFENEEAATKALEEIESGVIVVGDISFRKILEKLVATPYKPLSIVIPELQQDDIAQASFPELMFLLDLVIEVNGLKLFQSFLKKTITPLIPKLLSTVIDSVSEGLTTYTGTQTATNGDQVLTPS